MSNLQFTTTIQAHKEKVWNTMLEDATYRIWTEAFSPGSHFIGDWSQGSKMLFLGPDPTTGKLGGMVSRIQENRQHDYISIVHLGMVIDGLEDTTSDAVKAWAGSHENYTLTENGGITKLVIDIDVADDMKDYFEDMWPKALIVLKELAEK